MKNSGATKTAASEPNEGDWIAFTPERLQSELAQGHSVFRRFHRRLVHHLQIQRSLRPRKRAVREAFERCGVVKMKADWTNADPVITKTLKQFGRVGVPLYVLYPATEIRINRSSFRNCSPRPSSWIICKPPRPKSRLLQ